MVNCVRENKIRRDVICESASDLCRGRKPFARWSVKKGNGGGEARAYATPLGVYFDIKLFGLGDGVYTATIENYTIANLYVREGKAHLTTLTAKIPVSVCTHCVLNVERVT